MIITSIRQIQTGYEIGTSDGTTETVQYYDKNPHPDQSWPPELGSKFFSKTEPVAKLAATVKP
jgi:hypothetical protein